MGECGSGNSIGGIKELLARYAEGHLSGDGDALNADEAEVFGAFSLGI